MPDPKEAECTTCGWKHFILDDEVLSDWEAHGDDREPVDGDTPACPSPNMQWVAV